MSEAEAIIRAQQRMLSMQAQIMKLTDLVESLTRIVLELKQELDLLKAKP